METAPFEPHCLPDRGQSEPAQSRQLSTEAQIGPEQAGEGANEVISIHAAPLLTQNQSESAHSRPALPGQTAQHKWRPLNLHCTVCPIRDNVLEKERI